MSHSLLGLGTRVITATGSALFAGAIAAWESWKSYPKDSAAATWLGATPSPESNVKSPNSRIWQSRGLTGPAIELADAAMPHMMEALQKAEISTEHRAVAESVFAEAYWQLTQLPKLDGKVADAVRWKQPKRSRKKTAR